MRRKLLPLAIATVLACVAAGTGLAAGSTEVEHFSYTVPDNVCGFSGATAIHGTSLFRDTRSGTPSAGRTRSIRRSGTSQTMATAT
jgi:hypothetical protein